MKSRARRIALLTVAAGCLVIAGFVAVNGGTLADHFEARRLVRSAEIETVNPSFFSGCGNDPRNMLGRLAHLSGLPVLFDPAAMEGADLRIIDLGGPTLEEALIALRANGYRIVEARYPRRAYVVVSWPARLSLPPRGQDLGLPRPAQ